MTTHLRIHEKKTIAKLICRLHTMEDCPRLACLLTGKSDEERKMAAGGQR